MPTGHPRNASLNLDNYRGMEGAPLIGRYEAAARLGVPVRELNARIRRGEISATFADAGGGGVWIIDRPTFMRYLETRRDRGISSGASGGKDATALATRQTQPSGGEDATVSATR